MFLWGSEQWTPAPGTTIQSVVSRLHLHASSNKEKPTQMEMEKTPAWFHWSFLIIFVVGEFSTPDLKFHGHPWMETFGRFSKVYPWGSIRYTLEGSNINISIQICCFERASLAKAISDPGGQKTILLFLWVWSLLSSTSTVKEGFRMETLGWFFLRYTLEDL